MNASFFLSADLVCRWVEKKWNGPKQYTDAKTGELMM